MSAPPQVFIGTPNPEAYVPRHATDTCLAELEAWIAAGDRSSVVLAGPSGIGKTLMLHMLATRTRGQLESVYVPNPIFAPREMSIWALDVLKVPPGDDPEATLVRTATNLQREGSGLLLLIDNVELLPTRTQGWLYEVAARSDRALRFVVAAVDTDRCEQIVALEGPQAPVVILEDPMSPAETTRFVRAELERAELNGLVADHFDDAAMARIHERSSGLPMRVQREAASIMQGLLTPDSMSTLGAGIVSIGSAVVEEPGPAPALLRSESAPDTNVAGRPLSALDSPQEPLPLEAWPAEPSGAPSPDAFAADAPEISRPPVVASSPALGRRALSPALRIGLAFAAGVAVMAGIDALRAPSGAPVSSLPAEAAAVDSAAGAAKTAPSLPQARTKAAPGRAPERVVAAVAPSPQKPASPAAAPTTARETESASAPAAAPASLEINVNARPWATVWLDGRELGETPLAQVPVSAGRHRLEAHMPDGRVVEREVEISAENRYFRFD